MKKEIHITYQKKKKVSKISTTIRCIRTGIYVLQEVNKTPGSTTYIFLK